MVYVSLFLLVGVSVFLWGGSFVWGFPAQFVGGLLIVGAVLVLVATSVRRLHDIGAGTAWFAVIPVGSAVASRMHSDLVIAGVVLRPWHVTAAVVALPIVAGALLPSRASGDRFASNPRGSEPLTAMTPEASAAEARRLRARMDELALPTLLITRSDGPAFSKLGGKPELPLTMAWPEGRECPRCFVGQLDLTEVRAADGPDWLPAEGRLYFFYDEGAADSLDLVTCHATQEPPGPERSAPEGYEPDPMFNERRSGFERLLSMPSLDWLGVLQGLALQDDDFDELVEAPDKPFGDRPQHRIGGYASEIQGAQMELECEFRSRREPGNFQQVPPSIAEGAKDWRLLLQVDSDDELGMNWIDTGRLYVFIREQDARAGDFTKTATISQFY